MALNARMETVTVVDVFIFKLNIKNIDVVGIGESSVGFELLQDIPQDSIVVIPDDPVKILSACANRVIGIAVIIVRIPSVS